MSRMIGDLAEAVNPNSPPDQIIRRGCGQRNRNPNLVQDIATLQQCPIRSSNDLAMTYRAGDSHTRRASKCALAHSILAFSLTTDYCRNVRRFRMACSTFCAIRRGHSLSRLRIAWTDTPWSRARRSCSLADSSAGLAKPNSSTSFG